MTPNSIKDLLEAYEEWNSAPRFSARNNFHGFMHWLKERQPKPEKLPSRDKDCPICYPIPMGISPEGWRIIQEKHDKKHLPQCPTCKQSIK